MLGGVERAAAVAEPEIQPPIGPERQLATVVVLLGLVDVQQFADVLAVAELGDARVSTLVAPVQEQAAVGGEVGMERDPEQALLGADQHAVTDVELRLSLVPA